MTNVNVTKSIKVPASKVWEKVASFRGIENFSPVERSEVEGNGTGATRTCYMPDGAVIKEVLSKVNPETMEIQYQITEGPLPITGYLSTVKIEELDAGNCEVSWGAQFEVKTENKAAMEELFSGFYNVIIDSLEKTLAQRN